ncbi:serine hydrolase domain-containing protein [Jiangella asiatica]|uniref:Class A beta-lactamase-related serine hydrolase n=1 Tax=Jiangella asiatica TaxID=2530372 RepID=A0A4R5D896_9ACTN|nr:serine hydrolase domain-containing protein [Jiangella asiatica]TDE08120.1 class A beta-lactamase-related serine hydrolase [Jiangella asiatica]
MNTTNDTTAAALSRRSVLGMLGAVPVATGSGIALAGAARADETAATAASASATIPRSLRPGGEFDQYLADLAEKDEFAGTVLVRWRGHDVLSRSHGMANKEKEIPHGPDIVYTLGSVTKALTAIAITQLVAQGKVAYHEKLSTYVDGFVDPLAKDVTVHHLLTHSSGFVNVHQNTGYWQESRTWDSVEEVWEGTLKYVRQDDVTFPPGSSTEYSNTGFFALGAIVAATSGADSYYDYVREHVFEPAGMKDSDFYTLPEARDDPRIAHPYHKDGNGDWVDVIYSDQQLFVGTPSGGSFSTPGDLAAFAEAVMDDTLLGEPAWTHVATTPKLPLYSDPEITFAGYGLTCRLPGDEWSLAKNGGTQGVSANVEWFPESGWVAVVLSNYTKAAEPVADEIRRLIAAG